MLSGDRFYLKNRLMIYWFNTLGMESLFLVQNQEYYLMSLVKIQIHIFCILGATETNKLNSYFFFWDLIRCYPKATTWSAFSASGSVPSSVLEQRTWVKKEKKGLSLFQELIVCLRWLIPRTMKIVKKKVWTQRMWIWKQLASDRVVSRGWITQVPINMWTKLNLVHIFFIIGPWRLFHFYFTIMKLLAHKARGQKPLEFYKEVELIQYFIEIL